MNQEIKVGSKWARGNDSARTVVYVNSSDVVFETPVEVLYVWPIESFLKDFTPYIEPKPPLKVEAWVSGVGEIAFYQEGTKHDDYWTREPRLDYSVE